MNLDDYRRLSCAKYIIRAKAVNNSTDEELFIKSDVDFPKHAQKVHSFQTIATYTKDLIQLDITHIENLRKDIISPVPPWELETAYYDINYCSDKKSQNQNLLAVEVRNHLCEKYSETLKVYTDGSVLETGETGAAFVIPERAILPL